MAKIPNSIHFSKQFGNYSGSENFSTIKMANGETIDIVIPRVVLKVAASGRIKLYKKLRFLWSKVNLSCPKKSYKTRALLYRNSKC